MAPRARTFREAFVAKGYSVDSVTGCWNWGGCVGAHGYGVIDAEGRRKRAHRVALRLSGVEVPDDLVVMHSCDNRRCVNPAHLSVGTFADNTHDMIAKGRALTGDRHPHRINGNPMKGRGGATHPLFGRRSATCRKGHPMTAENVIETKQGRRCRICRDASNTAFRSKSQGEQA
jgi:hypothetical protein